MKQIRQRLTYANVMSSIAVFLVLGGATAFAATKIGANELKANSIKTGKIVKEAVTTSKVKNGAVTTAKIADKAITGAKLDTTSLGTVPNATNAVNAVNAQKAATAQNAATVNGQSVAKFATEVAEDGAAQTALNFQGVKLTASCNGGEPALEISNSSSGIITYRYEGVDTAGTTIHGGSKELTPTSTTDVAQESLGAGTIDALSGSGAVIAIQYAYRDDGLNSSEACRFYGSAIGG